MSVIHEVIFFVLEKPSVFNKSRSCQSLLIKHLGILIMIMTGVSTGYKASIGQKKIMLLQIIIRGI